MLKHKPIHRGETWLIIFKSNPTETIIPKNTKIAANKIFI